MTGITGELPQTLTAQDIIPSHIVLDPNSEGDLTVRCLSSIRAGHLRWTTTVEELQSAMGDYAVTDNEIDVTLMVYDYGQFSGSYICVADGQETGLYVHVTTGKPLYINSWLMKRMNL